MSFRYPSRCSNCSATGHNRATCPSLLERVRKLESGEVEWDYGAEKAIQRKNDRAPRKCSYCVLVLDWKDRNKATGHNRRTCKRLKSDKIAHLAASRKWRADFVACLERDGIGPGALVKMPQHGWDHAGNDRLFFLTGIHWDFCTAALSGGKVRLFKAREMIRFDRKVSIDPPDMFGMDGETVLIKGSWAACGEALIDIVSPSSTPFAPPAGFVNDTAPVDKLFKRK